MHIRFKNYPPWKKVLEVASVLKDNGFSAFVVGGCVRDFLLQREPRDFDMVTDASTNSLLKLFPKAISIGLPFGVFILPYKNFSIELSSFRKDGPYADGRRPVEVSAGSITDDAARRDFSINALFYNLHTQEILDFHQGQDDLQNQTIKSVGLATTRFAEDHLRVMRALRFCVELNFSIEEQTKKAILQQAVLLKKISKERLGAELRKMFSANLVKALQLLKEYAVLPVLFTHFRYADIKEKLAQLDTSNYLLKPQAAVKSSLCQEQKKQHKLLKPYFLLLSIIVAQSDLPKKSLKALSFIEDLKQLKFTKAEVQSLNTLYQLLCLLMHFPLKEFLNNTPLQKDFTQWLGSSTADAICSVDDSKTGDAKIIDKFKITNSSLNDPRWNGHYQLANLMDMAKQDKAVNECIKFFLCKNSVFSLEVIERFKVYVQIVDFLEEKPLVVKWPNTGAEHIAPHNRSKLLNLVYAYKMLPLLKTVLVEPV